MTLKEEKIKRNKFLFEVYKIAKAEYPGSPISVFFGLSKHKKFNLQTREYVNNDDERGGYIIGENLGLSQDEVDAIVIYFSSNEIGYMTSTLGLGEFAITQSGILYLESLEDEVLPPIQIHQNTISFGANSTAQIQQNTANSSQSQQVNYTNENITELLKLLEQDLTKLNSDQAEELKTEINNAIKQLDNGKDIKSRLLTIGEIVKDIGVDVFVGLISSPIVKILKPLLGLPI
jgi:hypothetical protein